MKKTLLLLMAILMIISFAACSKNPSTSPTETQNPSDGQSNTESPNNNTQTDNPNENQEHISWGVTGRFSARNDEGTESCFINLPVAAGATTGYGMMVVNADKTAILYAGQNDKSPSIANISELFPAYFERLEYDLKAYYGFLSENYEFTLTANTSEKIGEYEMHRFAGNIEFDNDGKHCKYPFIAYAAPLKSNGAYAYWVVYDVSDNQSNGQLIAEHALNMAKTFREVQ